ncbi:hypothetical protein BaRGS_00034711 [Batillaria attramentaria]|uniref:Uncharacterized protein n=1 Tax=Batillaria attramentaria TaxID=370345 RepID=A0ABD0JGW5_9CAEN
MAQGYAYVGLVDTSKQTSAQSKPVKGQETRTLYLELSSFLDSCTRSRLREDFTSLERAGRARQVKISAFMKEQERIMGYVSPHATAAIASSRKVRGKVDSAFRA